LPPKHLKNGLLIMVSCGSNNQKRSSLKHEQKLEEALALIIACTRRVKRPKDMVTLARKISYAEQRMDGLEAVAQAVKLSVQQLKDFLSVENLCAEVRALVKNRAIDGVDIVKTISKLPDEKQKWLAEHFVKGRITSKDVRIIATFAKKFPHKSIAKVVTDYERTKDIRLYVAHFRLPAHFNNRVGLHKRFEEIVGKGEMRRLQFQRRVAVLEVTSLGYKKLREAVRRRRTTLRQFVTSVVEEMTERK